MKHQNKNPLKNACRLLTYVWKSAPEIFFSKIVIMLLTVVLDVYLNISLIRIVVDAITKGMSFGYIVTYICVLSGILLVELLLESVQNEYINPRAKRKIYRDIHMVIFSKVRTVDLKHYDDAEFYNDYIWALERADTEIINSFENVMKLVGALLSAAAMITIICSTDAWILGFVLMPILLNLLIGIYQNQINYQYEKEVNPYSRRKNYTKRVFYLKQYAKELKLFPVAQILLDNLKDSANQEIDVLKKYRYKKIFAAFFMSFSGGIVQMVLLLLYLSYKAVVQGAYTPGVCASMIPAVNMLSASLGAVFSVFPKIQKNGIYAQKIFQMIDYQSEIEGIEKNTFVPDFESLELRNVSFGYREDEPDIISNLSMRIRKGEKIAIVGLNGAGKTTLVNLMLHFYKLDEGKILYNGVDIEEYDVKAYRQRFGIIFQDFQVYALKLLENITMQDVREVDRNQILSLLEKVGLDVTKKQLDMTVTKEFDNHGLEFSGGERQKIAILRGLFRQGDVMIMDEASSALDPISERRINDLLFEQSAGQTMIVIAHRLATIRDVDVIYYLENGTIAEQGSHDELMQLNGKYAQLYRAQAEKYDLQ